MRFVGSVIDNRQALTSTPLTGGGSWSEARGDSVSRLLVEAKHGRLFHAASEQDAVRIPNKIEHSRGSFYRRVKGKLGLCDPAVGPPDQVGPPQRLPEKHRFVMPLQERWIRSMALRLWQCDRRSAQGIVRFAIIEVGT